MSDKKPNRLKRLADLRKEQNVTQTELGKHCGYSHSAVVKWENGQCEPSLEALVKIADYFNVTLDFLLGRIEPPPLTKAQKQLLDKVQTLSEEQVTLLLSVINSLK